MDIFTIVTIIAAVMTVGVVSWKSPEAASKGLNATVALFLETLFFLSFFGRLALRVDLGAIRA